MGKLGLKEAVAMAVGGMIGGGIYSAFGLVVSISGRLSWIAFLLAGIVALSAGYSYIKMNQYVGDRGGAPTYFHDLFGDTMLTGMVGWTLLFGYIVSMALYAYAFSSFFTKLFGRLAFNQIPIANLISILVIGAFVGLNLMGAGSTGKAEDFLTFFKVAVIGGFGIWGVYFAVTGNIFQPGFYEFMLNPTIGIADPFLGAAMSFVAFQGWQLLLYDQDKFSNPEETIRKAIYIAIPVATLLYVLVAFTTTSILELPVIMVSPETSLLYAALPFAGQLGALLIGFSALFSTASAVNATLFSSAQFSRELIEIGVLPDLTGVESDGGDGSSSESGSDGSDGSDSSDSDGSNSDSSNDSSNSNSNSDDGNSDESSDSDGNQIPSGIVIGLGVLSMAFAVYGSLMSITTFASLAFIAVFGGVSYVAYRERDNLDIHPTIPVVGTVGCTLFFPVLLYDLYVHSSSTFWLVVVIGLLVVGSELVYFKFAGAQTGGAQS
ncbi:cationic amino acid transporter, putative [Haladaptatus paucihalophilus DX253]|uniref:Amino acid permease n=1 Tax=Haladaptatus paucihalophilus DX253 TaxID=797209 RepID=E7QN06_HALPU|nr:APC family permease [Haladaptatus paucihalophilus]EFW93801.1 cationic amino acid transporter, putative [Haladaptatus paucihalophilus DX253]SHL51523.1 Amino acid permease [Haladaptatus paucihalophilus DX253]